jgi:diguanylate cyclase (GGDEF)-like protein
MPSRTGDVPVQGTAGALERVGDFGPLHPLVVVAHGRYLVGDHEQAAATCTWLLPVARLAGDDRTQRYLHYLAAIVAQELGRLDEAEEHVRALLAGPADPPDRLWRAKGLSLLAEVDLERGHPAKAMDRIAAATRLVEGAPATYQHLSATQAIGLAMRRLHLYEQSDAMQMSLLGHPGGGLLLDAVVLAQAALTRTLWGVVVELTGDHEQAGAHYLVSLSRVYRLRRLAQRLGHDELARRADLHEGFLRHRLGDTDNARLLLTTSWDGVPRETLPETRLGHTVLALLSAEAGDGETAAEHVAAARRSTKDDVLLAWSFAVAAQVADAGRPPTAAATEWRELARYAIGELLTERTDRYESLRYRILLAELSEESATAVASARLDPLTGVGNRRLLEDRLAAGGRYSAVFVDIDHFKRVNDEHSHAVGDAVLVRLGELLRRQCRADDLVVRYGGDEFVVLVPSAQQDAERVATRVLAAVRTQNWAELAQGLRVSVSIGVSRQRSVGSALRCADGALQRAKRRGRDRVVVAAETGPWEPSPEPD